MRFIVDAEKNFLSDDKILKCMAFGLRNNRGKDQELTGHPVDWKECGLWSRMGLAQTSFRHLGPLSNSGCILTRQRGLTVSASCSGKEDSRSI